MLFDDMLIHKAAILELDMVDDGEGGQIEKWVDTGNRLSCLFDTPSSAELISSRRSRAYGTRTQRLSMSK
jgi:hypothetical protein